MWRPALFADSDGAVFALAGGPGAGGHSIRGPVRDGARARAPDARSDRLRSTRNRRRRSQVPRGRRGCELPAIHSAVRRRAWPGAFLLHEQGLGARHGRHSRGGGRRQGDRLRCFLHRDLRGSGSYARLFPAHTAALVLDSVVASTGVDAFLRPNFTSISSVLAANCSQHQCRGITRTPLNDLKRLTARARSKGALSLRYVDKTGKVRDVGATQADLFFFMVEVFSFDAAVRFACRARFARLWPAIRIRWGACCTERRERPRTLRRRATGSTWPRGVPRRASPGCRQTASQRARPRR